MDYLYIVTSLIALCGLALVFYLRELTIKQSQLLLLLSQLIKSNSEGKENIVNEIKSLSANHDISSKYLIKKIEDSTKSIENSINRVDISLKETVSFEKI